MLTNNLFAKIHSLWGGSRQQVKFERDCSNFTNLKCKCKEISQKTNQFWSFVKILRQFIGEIYSENKITWSPSEIALTELSNLGSNEVK